jgi:hypothetical protein
MKLRYIIFKEENYAGLIKTLDNFSLKNIYEDSGNLNNNYKTCMALSEMQELLKEQTDLIDSANELVIKEEQVTDIQQYLQPVHNIFFKVRFV